MTIVIHTDSWNEEDWLMRFSAQLPGRTFRSYSQIDGPIKAEYAVLWKPPADFFTRVKNLKVVFSLGAGVDHILQVPNYPAETPLVRVVDANLTGRMSEYIVLQCLSILRRQPKFARQQAKKIWASEVQPSADQVRIGILGLGELGLDAARKLSVMGFAVSGWARRAKDIAGINTFHGAAGLDDMLKSSDIVVCLLPLTPDTDGILNYQLFAKLPGDGVLGGPFVINAGRGGLQREGDILQALDDDILAGATLDVFETEPLPVTSPLWSHPKVIVTPHNAADSSPEAICANVARQIKQFEAGKPLENVVNPRTGY